MAKFLFDILDQHSKALSIYEELIFNMKETLGDKHPEVMMVLEDYIKSLCKLEQLGKAQEVAGNNGIDLVIKKPVLQ